MKGRPRKPLTQNMKDAIEKYKEGNLEKTCLDLKEALEHYAGEPFETNDTYLNIFDLITVKGSVTEFDSDIFTETARECLERNKEILEGLE